MFSLKILLLIPAIIAMPQPLIQLPHPEFGLCENFEQYLKPSLDYLGVQIFTSGKEYFNSTYFWNAYLKHSGPDLSQKYLTTFYQEYVGETGQVAVSFRLCQYCHAYLPVLLISKIIK